MTNKIELISLNFQIIFLILVFLILTWQNDHLEVPNYFILLLYFILNLFYILLFYVYVYLFIFYFVFILFYFVFM